MSHRWSETPRTTLSEVSRPALSGKHDPVVHSCMNVSVVSFNYRVSPFFLLSDLGVLVSPTLILVYGNCRSSEPLEESPRQSARKKAL